MATRVLQNIPHGKGRGTAARWARRNRNVAGLRTIAPKLRADYSDLLGMSDISDQPSPAASPDALLNKLVQEHLVRAGAAAVLETGAATVHGEALQEPAADLIIPSEPFKATEAPAAVVIPSEPFKATEQPAAEVIASEPFKATEPKSAEVMASAPFEATSPDHGGASVSAAELDALLSQDAKALVDQENETAAASTAPAPLDDTSAQINQADGVMAAELKQLMGSPAAAAAPADSKVPLAMPLENAGKVAAASLIVQAPHPRSGATKTTRNWFAAIFHDLLLMLAQAMDLPFMKLSEESKKLIAFAGLVLLASGSVLLIVGCLHH